MTFRTFLMHVPIALVLAFAIGTGVRGIDFGYHWDEGRLLTSAGRAIESATILPDSYNYPSFTFGLALAGAAPEAMVAFGEARMILGDKVDKSAKKTRLSRLAHRLAVVAVSENHKLRIRMIFLLVSLLSVAWVYLYVFLSRRSWIEAFFAAGLLALSWEVGYHARWIAPDAIVMQFAALSILTLHLALDGDRRRWFWIVVATVVAGLACGTKYTGGVLLLPVLAIAYSAARTSGESRRRVVGRVLVPLTLIFGVVFVVTTPGAVLQPFRFVYDVLGEIRHYQSGHGEHTIAPGPVHAIRMIGYLSLSAFSRYWPLALAVFLCAIGGKIGVLRHKRNTAMILLLVPGVFFIYMSMQQVMIVRNLLLLLPYLAILAARGASLAAVSMPSRIGRYALAVAAVLLLVANGLWLQTATDSIAGRSAIDHGREMSAYLAKHPEDTFAFSRGAYQALAGSDRQRSNVTLSHEQADRVLVMTSDLRDWYGNRFSVFEMVSGPLEVNLDYYPSWMGDARVFVVDRETADWLEFKLPLPEADGPSSSDRSSPE